MFTEPKSLENAFEREQQSVEGISSELKTSSQKSMKTPHGSTSPESLHRYREAIFSWTVPQYVHHEKTTRWYLIAGAIMVLSMLGSFLAGNWSFALVIAAFSVVYYYFQEHHPPENIQITISQIGIMVGSEVYPFTHIEAFWILYHPPFIKTLNLRVHEKFFSDIVIQLGDEDPTSIRKFLCGEIREWEGKNEKFSDAIVRLLKL